MDKSSSIVLHKESLQQEQSPVPEQSGSGELSLKSWVGKGFWAVMDQGLFAGSNFLLNIVLARWLSPSDYGTFVVAYTVFWLLAILHNTFLIEPMLVFGAKRYQDNQRAYLSFLLYGHWGLCAVLSIILFVGGAVLQTFGHEMLGVSFWALALAGPFMSLLWFMRRLCYVHLLPKLAAMGGGMYFMLVGLGVAILMHEEWLSIAAIFALIGITSLLSSIWIAYSLQIPQFSHTGKSLGRDPFIQHWHYGKWAVGAGFMAAIPDDVFSILLPIWGGLEASGALRALTNLIMVPMHALGALGSMIIPAFVRIQSRKNYGFVVIRLMVVLLLATVSYWFCLGIFGEGIMDWLYQGKYTQYAGMLWVIGLVPVFHGMTIVFSGVFLAAEQPRLIFMARLCSTIMVMGLGIGLMSVWGLWGAGVGMTAGFTASTAVLFYLYMKKRHEFLAQV